MGLAPAGSGSCGPLPLKSAAAANHPEKNIQTARSILTPRDLGRVAPATLAGSCGRKVHDVGEQNDLLGSEEWS
jgi:hypothetical protein